MQYIDDIPIKTESFDYESKGENEALRKMEALKNLGLLHWDINY